MNDRLKEQYGCRMCGPVLIYVFSLWKEIASSERLGVRLEKEDVTGNALRWMKKKSVVWERNKVSESEELS